MSWLDDLVDVGSSVLNWFGQNPVASSLVRTVVSGYALNQVTKSINKDNAVNTSTAVDPGVRLQVDPDAEHKIPVVYGRAVIGGIITDDQLVNANQSMFFCLTLCEQTGNRSLGSGAASSFSFKKIYWDDQLITFASDGVTVASLTDRDGVVDTKIAGLVKIYCYNGSSSNPKIPDLYSGTLYNAYTIMPGWNSNYTMSGLIFAIVRVDYSKEKSVTKLGNIKFDLENSMNQPGDCLYDYMTNTRYGAGIPSTEIYSS
jgi:hypothetical protein